MKSLKNHNLAPKNVLLAGISFYKNIKVENNNELKQHAQVRLFENPLEYDNKIYDCLKFTIPAGQNILNLKLTCKQHFKEIFIIDDKRKMNFLNKEFNDGSYSFSHTNFSKRKEQTILLFFCLNTTEENSLSKVVMQYNIKKAFKFNQIPEDFNFFFQGFSLLNSSTQA